MTIKLGKLKEFVQKLRPDGQIAISNTRLKEAIMNEFGCSKYIIDNTRRILAEAKLCVPVNDFVSAFDREAWLEEQGLSKKTEVDDNAKRGNIDRVEEDKQKPRGAEGSEEGEEDDL